MNIPARSRFKTKNAGEQSKRFVNNRRRRVVYGCILVIISAISWLVATSNLSHLAAFDIQEINIKGADSDISSSLQVAALQAIQGNYFGIFSRSNSFIYSKSDIESSLKASETRVNDVKVSRGSFHSLDIIVSEKKPAAVICVNLPNWDGSILLFDSTDSCYLVDNSGFAFKNASTSDTGINRYYMPHLANTASPASILGAKISSTTMFKTLQSFYNGARNYGIDVRAVLVKDGGEYELYAGTNSGVIVVYFNEMNGLENELTALISFWNEVSQKAYNKSGTLQLDSIDLRYGSNVFYRAAK